MAAARQPSQVPSASQMTTFTGVHHRTNLSEAHLPPERWGRLERELPGEGLSTARYDCPWVAAVYPSLSHVKVTPESRVSHEGTRRSGIGALRKEVATRQSVGSASQSPEGRALRVRWPGPGRGLRWRAGSGEQRGLAWPPSAISSRVEAPVAAAQVSPEWRRSWR